MCRNGGYHDWLVWFGMELFRGLRTTSTGISFSLPSQNMEFAGEYY